MRQSYRVQPSLTETWLDVEHAQELKVISGLLDADRSIYELAYKDLRSPPAQRASRAGAHGLSAEQVVRALLLKQMNGFSYRELAFHLADSRSYRTFCRLGIGNDTPKKSALQATIKALTPETLEAIHQCILQLALDCGVERGTQLRVDTTVVETHIHHPTDSELLWDCVRVLTRILTQARKLLGPQVIVFNDRRRRAKKRRREINSARTKRQRVRPYRDLIRVTEHVRSSAQTAREVLARLSDLKAKRLTQQLDRYLELSHQVIDQTRRRILGGKSVPAEDKIVSIFEDHTDIIRKDRRDTLYGHKICLTAGTSSLVFDCQILQGNPADSTLAVTMIERHVKSHSRAPRQVAFDGGFSSRSNLDHIKELGVEDVVFAKGRGLKVSEMAKSSWVFQRLRNFRAGIEGIISFLKRVFGLDRCNWRSQASFHSYVWGAIITSNLLVIARHLL